MGNDATPTATPAPNPDSSAQATPKRQRPNPPKQEKPFKDFPLFWHSRGYWACKREGKQIAYEADWKISYDRFKKDEDARENGQLVPSQAGRTHTVRDAVKQFLDRELERLDDGQISDVQFAKYRIECEHFAAQVGAGTRLSYLCGPDAPSLFRTARMAAVARGLVVAERHLYCVRKMLDLAHRRKLMGPANFEDSFDKPAPAQVERAKIEIEQKHGARAWSVEEIREIVQMAYAKNAFLFAQILLALNVGFGSDDCALLRDGMIDWDRERVIIRTYRGKTMRRRLCPLWPITIQALDGAREIRFETDNKELADRVFLTNRGELVSRKISREDEHGRAKSPSRVDAINLRFRRMLDKLDERERQIQVPTGKRTGKVPKAIRKFRRYRTGFYSLRAMFRSMAVGCGVDRDLIAVVMGQKFDRKVDEYYLRGDLRAKLYQVVDHVYWDLFGGWCRRTKWSLWPRDGAQAELF